MQLDSLITKATVFDGESSKPKNLDVGLIGERIAYVGEKLTGANARETIDASGLYLCPGFIDMHASTGLGYTLPHAGDNKLYQGVTTEIIGNCGTSTAPIGDLLIPTIKEQAEQIGFEFDWRTLAEWFAQVEDYGLPFNFGTFVGHNTLRAGICSDIQRVTENEISLMCKLLEQAMLDGALGLSTGLVYEPGGFADTAEIVELAKVAAKYGGIYVSHIRNERERIEEAIEEAIEIGRAANIAVLVSHLKAAEKPNWGKIPKIIAKIEAARSDGVRVTFEVYPYTATSTKLRTFIPKESLSDGIERLPEKLKTPVWQQRCIDWLEGRQTDYASMVLITESIPNGRGRSIEELARKQSKHPAQTIIDILINDPEAWIVYDCISEADMDAAIFWQHSIICSDSWSYPVNAKNAIGDPHPRTYGAFTRFLERYAFNGRIPFGQAVRKITSLPADFIGIQNRGQIKENYFADLVLLDPEKIKEKATFEKPRQFSEGTEYVWVNGKKMVEGDALVSFLPGKIIKRTQE